MIKKFLKTLVNALPFVFLGFFLFITIYLIFGMHSALLGIIFLFMSRGMMATNLSKVNYLKYGLTLVIIAGLSGLAQINTYTSVIINFLALFVITFVYSDDFSPKNHFLLGLELVLLQIMPCEVAEIPLRMLATIYAFIITTIFIVIMNKFKPKPLINPAITQAYEWILNQLKHLENKQIKEINVEEIYDLTTKYTNDIHSNVLWQEGILNNKEKFEFRLLLYAEQLAQLIYDISKHQDKLTKADYIYFTELRKTLERTKTYEDLRYHLNKFINKYKLSDHYFNEDWKLVLESLVYTLNKTEECQNYLTNLKRGFRFKVNNLRRRFSFNHLSFRVAVQTSTIVALCFLLADIIPIIDTYWIPITAYTTISTYPDDTLKDTVTRVLGTIAGMTIFALITQFILDTVRLPLVLLIGFTLIMCTRSIFINMVIGTQMSVAALYPYVGLASSMLIRVSFVIIGAIVVIVGVRAIMHVRKEEIFKHKLKELLMFNRNLIFDLKDILNNQMNGAYISEKLVIAHLIIGQLKKLSKEQNLYEQETINKILNYNYRFLMDINKVGIMAFKNNDEDKIKQMQQEIEKLDDLVAGEIDLKNVPKNIYQIKKYSSSYTEFQIAKSGLIMSKLLKKVKTQSN